MLLTAAPDGRIWAAAEDELVRVDRKQARVGLFDGDGILGGPLLLDVQGSLWAADPEATSCCN